MLSFTTWNFAVPLRAAFGPKRNQINSLPSSSAAAAAAAAAASR